MLRQKSDCDIIEGVCFHQGQLYSLVFIQVQSKYKYFPIFEIDGLPKFYFEAAGKFYVYHDNCKMILPYLLGLEEPINISDFLLLNEKPFSVGTITTSSLVYYIAFLFDPLILIALTVTASIKQN